MIQWKQRLYPAAVLLLSTVLLVTALIKYQHTFFVMSRPTETYAPGQSLSGPDKVPDTDKVPPTEPDFSDVPDNPVDFDALQEEFPEAVGWITIPNTNINYAIMQSGPDTPEDFYLNHLENGKKHGSGSIYIQRYNTAELTDPNTIIYGHNMGDGSMFANVHKFKKKDFFEANDTLYIYIPGHQLVYRIYSVFSYDERNPESGGIKHLLWAYDFDTEEGRQAFIDKTLHPKGRVKQVREGVVPTLEDRFVTLSTCIDGRQNSGRLLLVAVLEEDILTK